MRPPAADAILGKLQTFNSPAVQRLPDEILLQIFLISGILSPLDHAHLAATCTRFRRLAEDRAIWRDVSLKPYRSFTDDFTIQILVCTRFAAAQPGVARLQSLDISKCSNVTDVAVGLIARGCAGLVKLDLSECIKISDWSLAELGKRCTRLQDLSVKLCADITDAGIKSLVDGANATQTREVSYPSLPLSSLTSVSASRKAGPSSVSLVPLRHLDVSWCDKLSDLSLEHIGNHCPNLIGLKVSFSGRMITDRGIQRLLGIASSDGEKSGDGSPLPSDRNSGENDHPLRVLEAAMCPSLTPLALRALLDRAPYLETLVVTWCDKITPNAVSEFRRNRPSCSVQYNTAPMAL